MLEVKGTDPDTLSALEKLKEQEKLSCVLSFAVADFPGKGQFLVPRICGKSAVFGAGIFRACFRLFQELGSELSISGYRGFDFYIFGDASF